jgi:hypothetical protein
LTLYIRISLKYDSSKIDASATMLQLEKIQECKNSLHWKIKVWTTVQHLYMPAISSLWAWQDRDASDGSAKVAPYNFPLHMPCSLPAGTTCDTKLHEYKLKMREAQGYEALKELCQQL